MRIPSNKTSDIAGFIKAQLKDHYDMNEINSFIYILFEYFCKIDKVKLLAYPSLTVSESELLKINNAVKDLKKFKPIQYIAGETEFYGLKFLVDPSVLIPRPETEELINWIISENRKNNFLNIIDIGTGSGCIAITLKTLMPDSVVSAIDISSQAIETAKKNADLNNVEIPLINADILNYRNANFPILNQSKFDIIVSNPPYVKISEKLLMKENVTMFEPEIALFVDDDDPLLFYSKILDFAKDFLTVNGKVYFEINEKLGKETLELCNNKGFTKCIIKKDINNKERMICCSK
jgi:release factor glutamine methyltransferase